MRNYNLSFISDKDVYNLVKETVQSYKRNLTDFSTNIIDPIKLTFDTKVYGKDIETIIDDECFHQIDKNNINLIESFHKNLFKCAPSGWTASKEWFDVENAERHIYVYIKNRCNTMDLAFSRKTYINMQSKLLDDDQATCYLVEVISGKSRDEEWTVTVGNKQYSHNRIRRMSMDKFCELVFGIPDAFYKLCITLPQIIDDVVNEVGTSKIGSSVFEGFIQKNPDLLKALFLLAFSNYEGFNQSNEK